MNVLFSQHGVSVLLDDDGEELEIKRIDSENAISEKFPLTAYEAVSLRTNELLGSKQEAQKLKPDILQLLYVLHLAMTKHKDTFSLEELKQLEEFWASLFAEKEE